MIYSKFIKSAEELYTLKVNSAVSVSNENRVMSVLSHESCLYLATMT